MRSEAFELGKEDYLKYGYTFKNTPFLFGTKEAYEYSDGMTHAFKLNSAHDVEIRDRRSLREWYDELDAKSEKRKLEKEEEKESRKKRLQYIKASRGG